jgi:hypothetical protein
MQCAAFGCGWAGCLGPTSMSARAHVLMQKTPLSIAIFAFVNNLETILPHCRQMGNFSIKFKYDNG